MEAQADDDTTTLIEPRMPDKLQMESALPLTKQENSNANANMTDSEMDESDDEEDDYVTTNGSEEEDREEISSNTQATREPSPEIYVEHPKSESGKGAVALQLWWKLVKVTSTFRDRRVTQGDNDSRAAWVTGRLLTAYEEEEEYMTNESLTDTNYDARRKPLNKDYGLDLAGELQTKLDELRLDYEVLTYKLKTSRSTSKDLLEENERLRRELSLHTVSKSRSDRAMLEQSSDISRLRDGFRAAKADLETSKFDLRDRDSKIESLEASLISKTRELEQYKGLYYSLMDTAQKRVDSKISHRDYKNRVSQINNNHKRSMASLLDANAIDTVASFNLRTETEISQSSHCLTAPAIQPAVSVLNDDDPDQSWLRKPSTSNTAGHPVQPSSACVAPNSARTVSKRRAVSSLLPSKPLGNQPAQRQIQRSPTRSVSAGRSRVIPVKSQVRRNPTSQVTPPHNQTLPKSVRLIRNKLGCNSQHTSQLLHSKSEHCKSKAFYPRKLGTLRVKSVNKETPDRSFHLQGVKQYVAEQDRRRMLHKPHMLATPSEPLNTNRSNSQSNGNSQSKLWNISQPHHNSQPCNVRLKTAILRSGRLKPPTIAAYSKLITPNLVLRAKPMNLNDRPRLDDFNIHTSANRQNSNATDSGIDGNTIYTTAVKTLNTTDNRKAVENQNNNALENTSSDVNNSGTRHKRQLRQHLRPKEQMQKDMLEAFTDALLAREAAVALAAERLECLQLAESNNNNMKKEYEQVIDFKNNELRIKDEVISAYKTERLALTQAFEKATKCMLNKLSAKNAIIRKMNSEHHDELSQLRSLVLQLESEVSSATETLQRKTIFHERELEVFNQKVRELHDLLKQKNAELHNYQRISADIVHMAEKMNIDLHVKDELIKQLHADLANFQMGINEVEGDRVLVKQSKQDKRVISVGFPRIVDGSVVIWYKSKAHGDNFLLLRIFGGKLFPVQKKDIIPELNRILPNVLNSPSLAHAALKQEKSTQAPSDSRHYNPPSAMQMEIHNVGMRSHLAMQGRHLCSGKPIMFVEEDENEYMNKEIIPRPYVVSAGAPEKAILLLEEEKSPNRHKCRDNESDDSEESTAETEASSSGSATPTPADTPPNTPSIKGGGLFNRVNYGNSDSTADATIEKPQVTTKTEDDSSDYSSSEESSSKHSSYMLEAIALMKELENQRGHINNKSKNARSASSSTDNTERESDETTVAGENVDVNMNAFTEVILGDMKRNRARFDDSLNDNSESNSELKEFTITKPPPPTSYSLEWLEKPVTDRCTKKRCCSPGLSRLREMEEELNSLSNNTATISPHYKQETEGSPELNVREAPRMDPNDDYDWSLPDLDLPKEYYEIQSSSHENLGEKIAACGLRKQFPDKSLVVLKDDTELMTWKAKQLGDDYKFTRISNDKDLRQFIQQSTKLPEDTYQPAGKIVFDTTTRRYKLEESHDTKGHKIDKHKKKA